MLYKGMKKLQTYSILLSICISSGALHANPDGGTVVNGSANFSQQGNTLTVTNTPGTIINWQGFSIQSDETTRFIQQSSDSAVLNRVVGQDPSQILGKLQSNGRVFIINPNGISFGANSIVDVSGLAASTLNLSNEDFLSNNLNFIGDGNNGSINNNGAITTSEGGFVYLISSNVENHGIITSPKGDVILAAGHSVQLVNSDDPDIRVTLTAPEGEALNVGEIITRGGKTSIYAGIINQQGTVNADSVVVGENGEIFFKATKRTTLSSSSITTANGNDGGSVTIQTTEGLTEVYGDVTAKGTNGKGGNVQILGNHVGIIGEANIDSSGQTGGGTILIGGDNKGNNPNVQNAKATYVGVDTRIHADANEEGDGGTVIVWSDEATRAYGTTTAKGGATSGDGGFVETSGGYLDVAGINLDVSAVNGNGGTWLLDPYDISISIGTTSNSGIPSFTPSATGSVIDYQDIQTQLNAGTSVTIDTGSPGGDLGNISVDEPLSTNGTGATLTLNAHNNITVNQSITSTTGALDIILTADQDSNNAGSVTLNSTLNSLGGNITITSAGDITLNSGVNTINAGGGTASLTSTNGIINGDPAGAPTDITASSVILNSLNGIHANGGSAQLTTSTASIAFNKSGTAFTSEVKIHNSYAGVTTITGTNSDGNISIFNTDSTFALNVGNLTATTNGYISINTDLIDITGSVNAGTNVVYLKNFVNNAAISIGGSSLFDINSTELSNITAGNIQIGKDPFGNYAGTVEISTSNPVDVGGKNLWVTSKNGITHGLMYLNNAGGQLYLDNITSGDITTGSGVITSDIIQFSSIGNINIGTGGLNSAASGDVKLFAADVNIGAPVNAGLNQVFLAPYLNSTPVSIEGSQTFNITSADLNNISAGSITIGENLSSAVYASTVDIASAAPVNIGTQTLKVFGVNNITFGANTYTATGENNFQSVTGNITTGTGLVSADILVLEGAGLMSVGTGGITTTNYAGLNGGNVYISGTVTTPILYFSVFTPGSVISIGGGQAYNIAQADIDFINATSTEIGNNPYVNNTSSIEMATTAPIDFGARNVIFKSDNGMTFGANAFKATGGTFSFNSSNTGFDISTGAGNIAANNVTMTSARDIIVNTGGINASNSITLNANNTIFQNGNLTANGTGTITLTATNQNITMAAGTVTTGGNGDIVYNAGNNISVAMLDSGLADITLNASANILDLNGNGVNNIKANNFTVSSGANTSLDYEIITSLNSSGVIGIADLRVYPAVATTTTSSTNEPLSTTISTIADSTNSLSLDTTSSDTTTLALAESSSSDGSTDTSTTGTTNTEETTTSSEESNEEKQSTSTTITKKQPKQLAKKLPICK